MIRFIRQSVPDHWVDKILGDDVLFRWYEEFYQEINPDILSYHQSVCLDLITNSFVLDKDAEPIGKQLRIYPPEDKVIEVDLHMDLSERIKEAKRVKYGR